MEIERRFLIDKAEAAKRDDGAAVRIQQGYLAVDENGTQVRVRRKGDGTVLTVKQGQGLERAEVELKIDEREFDRLWDLTADRRLEKRRHLVSSGELCFEIDVYAGVLEGLAVVEVEFESEEEASSFDPPTWFGRELTGEASYSNVELAINGLPEEGP